MALGDVASGERFLKNVPCHSIIKGGENKIGPALYNVVGRKVVQLMTTNIQKLSLNMKRTGP